MRRRIMKGNIKFVSLCPRGVNRMPVIYKAESGDNGTLDMDMLFKGDEIEKGELLGAVYVPEVTDSQGDVASADVIKDMMYDAAKNGLNIDIRHNEKPLLKSQAFIAESFIIQKGDPRFSGFKDYDGKPVDVTGGWGVVMKIEDKELRQKYKNGEWNGVSMGGTAQVKAEKSDEKADNIVARLAELLSVKKEKDTTDMTEAEVVAIVKKSVPTAAEIAAEIAKGQEIAAEEAAKLAKEEADKKAKEEASKGEQAPIFKGDPMNAEDVKKHADALKAFELRKSVDWANPKSVEEYQAKLADLKKSTENQTPEQKEVARLEKELAEAKKRSNQGAGGTTTTETKKSESVAGFVGAEAADFELGRKIAKAMNGDK